MPLKKGKRKETVSENISEMMHDYERSGKVGRSRPSSRKQAQKQAVAAALETARESGAKIPRKGKGKSTQGLTGGTKRKRASASRSTAAKSKRASSAPRKRASRTPAASRKSTATRRTSTKK